MAEQAKLVVESKEKVAFYLMNMIAEYERDNDSADYLKPNPRAYFLKLFHQCSRAADVEGDLPWVMNG
jgi:hypothetical protein